MKIALIASIALPLASFAVPTSAALLYSNDFSANTNGFSGAGSLTTSPSGQSFLGPLYNGGTNPSTGNATLSLTNIAANSAYTLGFSIYAIGSVDGDGQYGGGPDPFIVSSSASGTIFNQNFANFGGDTQNYPVEPSSPDTGAAAVGSLGYSGYPGTVQDSIYNFSITGVTGGSTSISFIFSGQTNEALNNEFYGIDNVTVNGTRAVSAVPLPPALPMFGAALLGLAAAGFVRRRNKLEATSAQTPA